LKYGYHLKDIWWAI